MVSLERASSIEASVFAEMEQDADVNDYVIPYTQAEHSRNLFDPELIYLRILSEGKLSGFIILGADADKNSIEFRRIVVANRGTGIGQKAIVRMEEYCRDELARSRIWLDVFEHNIRGQHIYEKLGYSRCGEKKHGEKTLLLYEKQLKKSG